MNTYLDVPEIKEEEFSVVKDILKNDLKISESSMYQKSFRRLKELTELKITGTFVCIGCGPLPTTLMFAEQSYQLKRLIGIDNDPLALDFAKKVHAHFSNAQADFYQSLQDAELHSSGPIHFFIANMVKPKAEILKQVWHLASEESLVIIREPRIQAKSQWDHIFDKIDVKEWHVEKVFQECPYFGSRSIVLFKSNQ